MSYTFNVTRWEITDNKGFTLTFSGADPQGNKLRCNDKSVVLANISEMHNEGGNWVPFVGIASMSIDNIAPGNDSVTVRGAIGWDTDLPARITLFVVE